MTVRLYQPLPRDEQQNDNERAMLDILQGNILRGHGRDHTAHVFLQFDPANTADVHAFLRDNADLLTSAREQADNAALVRQAREAGDPVPPTDPFVSCVLSNHGYAALGFDEHARPGDPAFQAGMGARGEILSDSREGWDDTFEQEIDAMITIGDDSVDDVDGAIDRLRNLLPAAVTIVGDIQRGRVYRNANRNAVEHFGYVDGRSQPLLREQDIEREAAEGDGIARWDPAFPLRQVLVRDPLVTDPNAFGSYLVFRKLEQNVAGFKHAEETLGEELARIAPPRHQLFDPELAGALIVGRFEDGTPILLQDAEGMHAPVPNDFDYEGDPQGLKCPHYAHIRKVNPRGDTSRLHGDRPEEERSHIMARRGITYGDRELDANDQFTENYPERGVGLLFMAFQSDIAAQFEFVQASWANRDDHVRNETGIDPIIGQGDGISPVAHRAGWGDAAAPAVIQPFSGFVALKGGEYFFAPSIEFFRNL